MLNIRIIFFILGLLISILGLTMFIPLLFNLISEENNSNIFLKSISITLFIGISLILAFKEKAKKINIKDTIVLTTISWPVLCFFASLPLYFDVNVSNYSDAFFEATSGLTTTGATIYNNVERLSTGLLIWRALLQWLGGLGIIIFAIAILPILNVGGLQLFTQSWNKSAEELNYSAKELAKLLGSIYLIFTFIIFILLYFSGLLVFDALCHAMTTIATGGFSTHSSSISFYDSILVETIIIIGMLIASLPFTLYLSTLRKNYSLLKDSQVIMFLSLVVFFTTVLTIWIYYENNFDIYTAFRLSIFNGISLMTGTGYSTANFSDWGTFSTSLLLFMMLLGGCTGSTTGGIKIFRINVLFLILYKELRRIKSPRAVNTISYQGSIINDEIINSVMIIIILFLTGVFLVTTIFFFYGYDFITAFSAGITSVSVVGPGMGSIIGPDNSFSDIPEFLKLTLSAAMIIGRLEFLAFLIILLPKFWSR
tara:strand:+ start:395 stop:1840 length:1446 start_codon:yes stop_codon:yes gene_type:complete